jgi:DNA gyrase/topoisomerase IV subunit B
MVQPQTVMRWWIARKIYLIETRANPAKAKYILSRRFNGGTAKQGRPTFQATPNLRGKTLNVEKQCDHKGV